MRITILMVLIGMLGCGDVPTGDGLRDILTPVGDLKACEVPEGSTVVSDGCGVSAHGVDCNQRCHDAAGAVYAGCALDEATWCVETCDQCAM